LSVYIFVLTRGPASVGVTDVRCAAVPTLNFAINILTPFGGDDGSVVYCSTFLEKWRKGSITFLKPFVGLDLVIIFKASDNSNFISVLTLYSSA
jgi:hypothetical protein